MPRTANKATVNNFVGGLVSDYHELNNPPNTTVDENNCDLDRKGSRKRRLGIDFEDGASPSTASWTADEWTTLYTKTFEWDSVGEDGDTSFLVVQGGNILSFYDMNFDTLSDGELPFQVDLDDHRAPTYYTTKPYPVQVAAGKGALFVVGEAIEPFFIQYDANTNTITTTPITIQIRDLSLQDTALDLTDQVSSLTAAQRYDFFNQGWWFKTSVDSDDSPHEDDQNVLDWYRAHSAKHLFPSKSKVWWLGQAVNEPENVQTFYPVVWDSVYVGTTLAPLGTYILDAFNQDRSGVSGIAGLPIVIETSRPTAVAFGAGRIFYGFKNKIFFSQVIVDDFSVAGKCYQDADPTSQKISDLIATDGGVLQIIESSSIIALFPYENSIFAFSSAGVWAIGGSSVGTGFSATDFSVYKVTGAGALNSRSLVSIEGTPCWWSKLGIYVLSSDAAKQGYSAKNILEKKLQLFYNVIPPLSKVQATGAYDRTKKVITWLYNATGITIGGNPYVGDTLLNYDTILEAFYKYTLSQTSTNSPYVTDVFNVLDIVVAVADEDVLDNTETVVLAEDLTHVTIQIGVADNAGNTSSSLKFLTFQNS